MKISVHPYESGQAASGALEITAGRFDMPGTYITIAVIKTVANIGTIVDTALLQLHEDKGTLRLVHLKERAELPIDKKLADEGFKDLAGALEGVADG